MKNASQLLAIEMLDQKTRQGILTQFQSEITFSLSAEIDQLQSVTCQKHKEDGQSARLGVSDKSNLQF